VRLRRNPYFPGGAEQGRELSRYRIFLSEVAVAVLLLLYLLLYSPLFQLDEIRAQGGSISESSLSDTAGEILKSHRTLGILPTGNYLFLRPSWLSQKIQKAYEQDVAFDSIRITKVFPNIIEIETHERGVVLLWEQDAALFGLDDRGVPIRKYTDEDELPSVARLVNDNAQEISLGQSVIRSDITSLIGAITTGLTAMGQNVESIHIPEFSCPNHPVNPENEATNSSRTNTNVSVVIENANVTATNINTAPDQAPVDCYVINLVFDARELHVKIQDGASILFVADNLDQQLEKLKRAIQDAKLDLKRLSYVDVRFGERVYYK
jgi:cell division protein ZapA (FtsZ GTPase activity inhibitor)